MAEQYQLPATGFDSYLKDIIPESQAITAGALSVSLQQIRNIKNVTPQAFAQVVYSMESTKDLPLVAGTDVPVDLTLADQAITKQALGSGPYGTYTMSNFYGAMSGLIYGWKNIYNGILDLETTALVGIYENLYLAATWQQALAQWDGTAFNFISRGGGYGRGNITPTATVNGVSVNVKIGTDPLDITTYGRIISLDYAGGPAGPVIISAPPGHGWPEMDRVVQSLIDAANQEIANIANNTTNGTIVRLLNAYWDITGLALKLEQRARFLALPPVPVPYDARLADRPTTINTFVDELPGWGSDTLPHMTVQTLEHIANYDTIGGQSVIAMLRAARNQERLSEAGIILDDGIPANIPNEKLKDETTNYTSDTATPDGGIPSPCEIDTYYTIPANPTVTTPYNYTVDGQLYELTGCQPGSILPILDCVPNPVAAPCLPSGPGVPKDIENRPINPFVVNPELTANPKLNSDFTGSVLFPSIYNVDEAINKVIECNCDCWVK